MDPKRYWALLFVLTSLFLFSACKKNTQKEPAATLSMPSQTEAADAFVFKVATVAVEYGTLELVRESAGRIEPERDVRVASVLGASVIAVPVSEGERVAKGQLLVKLDDRTYREQVRRAELALEQARIALSSAEARVADQESQLQSQLQAARQNLTNARKRLEEARDLLSLGGIAPVEVDALQAAYEQAKANAAAAEAAYLRWQRSKTEDLAQLRIQQQQAQVALDQARRALADTNILAPFAGHISERYVDTGAFVGPGSPVVRIVSEPRNVIFRLLPEDVARMRRDDVRMLYLGNNYPLKIVRTSPVPGHDRLIRVVARLIREDDSLPYGGAVNVSYKLSLGEGAKVPSAAVRVREGQAYVYSVFNGLAKAHPVIVVAEANGTTLLKDDNLPERVIMPLPQDLRNGVRVEVLQ